MIGRNGERRSGISAQAARHDDDDDVSFFGGGCNYETIWLSFWRVPSPTSCPTHQLSGPEPQWDQSSIPLSLSISLSLNIYIYIYIHPSLPFRKR